MPSIHELHEVMVTRIEDGSRAAEWVNLTMPEGEVALGRAVLARLKHSQVNWAEALNPSVVTVHLTGRVRFAKGCAGCGAQTKHVEIRPGVKESQITHATGCPLYMTGPESPHSEAGS